MVTTTAPNLVHPEHNAPEVEAAFEAVPPEMVGEILDGELFTFLLPERPQKRIAWRLGMKLAGPFDIGDGGPGGWVILDEPELHIGPRPDRLAPDIAGWTRERMPVVFDPEPQPAETPANEETPAFRSVIPDWVCEVVSPDTARVDRGKKMRIYRREGVRHLWLLTPLLRTLEVYRLEGGHWVLLETYEDDAVVRAEPFDAIELSLGTLWAP